MPVEQQQPEEQKKSSSEKKPKAEPAKAEETEETDDSGPKVVGKIDLDSMNQKTRPAKKAKAKKAQSKVRTSPAFQDWSWATKDVPSRSAKYSPSVAL